ncbi:tetratricopeptide repeat protein [Parendozoicomonas haliclonae]|uniref:Tetratricopeptide repeat protein n=1 Tax=Parendozoicomonas haliclonae TaxID=1960125 RepID=A0A1X7AEU8_9GAMM|nr:tetratricopeptide repeat protein [Parendozoicomonas haliclonae]SMA33835.1 hypothetical protein EHSB41UT_00335 [Parendozoicomonas haliclonae]
MVSADTLRLLADIGFMATSGGFSPQAQSMFKAIEQARPDSVLPHIGNALNSMNMNRHQEALDTLEKKALKLEPENPTVKAFIGMALMMLGRNSECERYLNGLTDSDDSLAASLASNLLVELKEQASKKSSSGLH